MTTIRPAEPRDAQAIADLMNPAISDTTFTFTTVEKTSDSIAAAIANHAANGWPYLVSEADHITGTASYASFRSGPGYVRTMELSVYASPDAMGRGTAKALMDALETHARANGVTTLIGGISGENPRAIAFHTKCGFAKTGHLPGIGHKFGRDLDLILMQKTLVSPAPHSP